MRGREEKGKRRNKERKREEERRGWERSRRNNMSRVLARCYFFI